MSSHHDAERRRLVGVGLRSSAANVALPLSAVLTGPLLARYLGPDGRGSMAALLAPVSLLNLMFTLGLPQSLTYHVARRRLNRRGALRATLVGALICGGAAVAVGLLITPFVLRRYPDLHDVFTLMLFTLPITLGFAALRGAVQGLGKFDSVSVERVVSVVLRLGLLVALVVTGALTASLAAWVTILAGAFASLALIPAFRRGPYTDAENAHGRSLTRYAAESALGTMGAFLVIRLDQTLMAPLSSAEQLGYYAVAVSLAELPITAVAAIRDMVFAVGAERDDPGVAARATRVTVLLMVPVCAVGVVAAPLAIPLLFGSSFSDAVPMTQILMGATIASSATAIAGAGLLGIGRAAWLSAAQVFGAVLTAGLLVLLVPDLGGRGAALASLLTYVALAAVTTLLFSRASGLPWRTCVLPTRTDVRDVGTLIRARRSPR